MNYSSLPASSSEAINDPHRWKHGPVALRPAAEQERAVLAHQARIDAARTAGLLLEPDERDNITNTYLWRAGYEKTERGIQLGQGLGYHVKVSEVLSKASYH